MGPPDRGAVEIVVALMAAACGCNAPPIAIEPVAETDWLADNRVAFAPFSIGRFFVCGTAYGGAVPAGGIDIRVDAGGAFGSGRHATTAGCLTALDGLAPRRIGRALDFGIGSGILAVAIAKRFRVPVVACDIDPRAVDVARTNARINGVAARVGVRFADTCATRAVGEKGPYDLVTSNILARPLIRLASGLARVTAPGGTAVLSGFLIRDAGRVLAAYAAHGFRLVRRIDKDGWRTLVVEKR